LLTGRESEIALLDAFVAGFVGGPSSLSLVGEAGVGKSILWAHAVEAAREAEIQVLEARPAERERDLAFVGLADLLEGVGVGRVELLPDGQRRALQVAVFRSEALDEAIDPHLIGLAVLAEGSGKRARRHTNVLTRGLAVDLGKYERRERLSLRPAEGNA
jgi:predicted ATPase